MTMTKTQAINATQNTVSIWGSGTSWTLCGPYRDHDPSGPSTESHADSYPKARLCATKWRARVALGLMGKLSQESAFAVDWHADSYNKPQTVGAMIAAGVKAYDDEHRDD
jgi:hypothetical protein